VADFSGLIHCLDARTGKLNWSYDMLAQAWGSPLIVEDKVYIGDEDGQIAIFRHSADPKVAMKDDGGEMVPYCGEIDMDSSVYSTPIVVDNVLYITSRSNLFAIEAGAKPAK
jgi:outer membrane protein assembly factor BamB